ncbi:MAG: hypothetical protein Q4D91_02745 [Lautropia sp.]|nr:hypothetical protein [Lautropia sp.]
MNRLQQRPIAARLKHASLAALAALGLGALGQPASAVESPLTFGEPIVMSAQGQRLKVLLPFETEMGDRATAVAFMVEKAEVPDGYTAPRAERFTVMRPDSTPYVIFHSADTLYAPSIMLTVSVAGDPQSPYQMRLNVPAGGEQGAPMRVHQANGYQQARRVALGNNTFRQVPKPQAMNDLPPK